MAQTMPLSLINDTQKRGAHNISKNGDKVNAPAAYVYLHHPYFEDTEDSVLLPLPACSLNTQNEPCVEYLLAWLGCYGLAINRAGFFTRERARDSERMPHGKGLLPGDYYYHLIDGDDEYETLLDWRLWVFRSNEMPQIWKDSYARRETVGSDFRHGSCAITGEDGGASAAHNVMKAEYQWWVDNNMQQHAAGSGVAISASIDRKEMRTGNIIYLNDGLHRQWDANEIAFIPLLDANGQWRPHVVSLQASEMVARNHHGRALQRGSVQDVAPCNAWARFMYQIFCIYEETFLTKQVKRRLGGSKSQAEWMSYADVKRHRLGRVANTNPKSRSNSPNKGARLTSITVDEDESLLESDTDSGYGEAFDGMKTGTRYVVRTVETVDEFD